MDIITDASSIINLANAGALETVATLDNCSLHVSPLVVGECGPTCAAELLRLQQLGLITFVNSEDIPAEIYLDLLDQYDLGEGETECLALVTVREYTFCCDDAKARRAGEDIGGIERVVGSLRLLKWAVQQNKIDAEQAFALYEAMKEAGGFLPEVSLEWFSS